MTVSEKLTKLRALMKERNISAYMIPTADFHLSEYVGEHFKARHYMSSFTGSAGTLVVFEDEAGVWTDGRYFLQGEKQLKDTPITLFKMGEEGVLSVDEYIFNKLEKGAVLGFDGRCVSAGEGSALKEKLAKKDISLYTDEDLVDLIWEKRPSLPKGKVFSLSDDITGESRKEKLEKVRSVMREKGAKAHILSALDDIAYIFNIRGSDIKHCPMVLSYAFIDSEKAVLFADEEKFSAQIKAELEADGVVIEKYESFYEFISKAEGKLLIEKDGINYKTFECIKDKDTVNAPNPSSKMKAVKNSVEIENIKKAHVKDGVAMVKFIKWIKENVSKEDIDETAAGEKLWELRKEQGCFDLSFATICAYGANGATIHYNADEHVPAKIKEGNLLLVDSGGQYFGATTDVTRTLAMGEISEKQKKHYALVLRAMLNLANAKFLEGTTGAQLDMIARQPLWQENIDYKHGTGHGIGYMLNVHEGPNNFRWYNSAASAKIEEGMITSDEPGIYIEGEYGIRIENEVLAVKGEKNWYGQFMGFEYLTYVPIDLDAIDASLLSEKEKEYLNEYHALVYAELSEHLSADEREWLRKYTKAV